MPESAAKEPQLGGNMQKVVVVLDYANIDAAARDAGCEIDHSALLNYLADQEEGRFLQGAFAYVPIDPRQEHASDAAIDDLWNAGYIVKSKVGTIAGPSYKCDFDVEITLDLAKIAYDISPDIVVLASGDSDFVPVVLDLRKKGIRVEIASFRGSMSRLLTNRCSGFINLNELINHPSEPDEAVEETPYEGQIAEIDGDMVRDVPAPVSDPAPAPESTPTPDPQN